MVCAPRAINEDQVPFVKNHQHLQPHMFLAFWYLLLFYFSVFSWAKPLVAPRLGELSALVGIDTSEINSHTIPSPPSFLYPGLRALTTVDTSTSMSSFAVLPLLAYSTLLAVFGFISVRIAKWRRKTRPAALALEDDGVELLPTNTSTLSPQFKDFVVSPPLPSSPVPAVHARSRSFSNLQHAALVQDLPERERPKSPIQFGLSSPGSRLKSKQRSHSVGSISSPLSPSKRRTLNGSTRRPYISDPEPETQLQTTLSTPNTPFPPQTQFGTLVDLSVPSVPVSSPMNSGFHPKPGSAHAWGFDPIRHMHSHPFHEEINLIDLHAPEKDVQLDPQVGTEPRPEPEPLLIPIRDEHDEPEATASATEQDSIVSSVSEDAAGYEPDLEGGEQVVELEKEVDIGWEWGFESVASLSSRVSPHSRLLEQQERDLVDVDGDSELAKSVQFHPIPMTASSSTSEGYLQLMDRERSVAAAGEAVLVSVSEPSSFSSPVLIPPPLSASASVSVSVISPPTSPRMTVLDAGRQPVDILIETAEHDKTFHGDNDTLSSIPRDDTSLDSDLISKVYLSDAEVGLGPGISVAELDSVPVVEPTVDVPEVADVVRDDAAAQPPVEEGVIGRGDTHVVDLDVNDNDIYDVYETNDYREDVKDMEDVEGVQEGRSDSVVVEDAEDAGVSMPLIPPSHENLAHLISLPDPIPSPEVEAAIGTAEIQEDSVESTPLDEIENGQENAGITDDMPQVEDEEQFPDPDLLPLPEPTAPAAAAKESDSFSSVTLPSPSPTQIPTPPASPPLQRRALPRPLPAWSVRAADAPPLGLASLTSTQIRSKASLQDIRVDPGDDDEQETTLLGQPSAVDGDKVEETNEVNEDDSSPKAPEPPKTAILPGAFPVDVHPLSDAPVAPEKKSSEASTSSSGDSEKPVTETSATSPSTTAVALPNKRRPTTRSPIDIALAMQLRPGLGLGADPAWMVRFLMAMFGWFVVLISGSSGDVGYVATPYVGIRRSNR
ncbi:hypothetical protein GYMLUDRAFT_248690 [Collybiopsis luxurians FD-317 M1]|uniref:Uncharacterized protein n=1 Tax=Collybiopsis luxurians FD-317 M1 TaxID=944289 RepID=A0A0D0BZR4_9AGAR|nr:hypothetical protein GYMLUDRAFT_248690 [Collybiopsis luxurians FD-317 M1]